MGRHLVSILVLLGALVSGSASSFPTSVDFDGSLSRWPLRLGDPPITYELIMNDDEDHMPYALILDEAAFLWTDSASSYFEFAPQESETPAQVSVHLERSIDGGDYSAGYAQFDEYDDKKPTHCSIHVALDEGMSQRSLAKTLLHELGHCVGLDHSLVPQAIMSYSLNHNSFALDLDDEAALARLYPQDGSAPKLPPGCAAGPWRTHASPPGLLMVVLLPLALACFLRSCRGEAQIANMRSMARCARSRTGSGTSTT